jgi:hypothetical protein
MERPGIADGGGGNRNLTMFFEPRLTATWLLEIQ